MRIGVGVLADAVWLGEGHRRWVKSIVLVVVGSLVVGLCAKLKVDIGPVPLTMQTLAVLTIGAAYGSRLGAATMLLYLAEGAAGLPVFAGPPIFGLTHILGPTGGYLISYPIAAALVGFLAERGFDRSIPRMLAATLLGSAVILVMGVLWLSTFLGMEKAVALGLMPFIIGDIIKATLAALAFPLAWRLIGRGKGGTGQPMW
ncbi:MAG TPA: biotin transporter BioY [Aestuariivirgaceae bacterium]|jgi:biotin transport system substrate-specific component|nr:biotin transporter BioY [Aestuariivirgaceae bacterium]